MRNQNHDQNQLLIRLDSSVLENPLHHGHRYALQTPHRCCRDPSLELGKMIVAL